MLIGYMRVSTEEQHLDLQRDALLKAEIGADAIYDDKMSGTTFKRPGLDRALKALRPGDTLVVWKLDRLGRDVVELILTVRRIEEMGCHIRSLNEVIDTTTAVGKLLLGLFAMLAQFERDLTAERTVAGLKAARARGSQIGRKPIWSDEKREQAIRLVTEDPAITGIDLAKALGVSRGVLYREVKGGLPTLQKWVDERNTAREAA